MYQHSYSDIIGSSSKTERANESLAIDRAIELMEKAQESGMQSIEAIEAQFYVQRLWGFFIDDLSSSDNALPEHLRAAIISIGIWFLGEIEKFRRGEEKSFSAMIEVLQVIREGLQ